MAKYESKILEIVNRENEHLTAEEIFFELKKSEIKVVLATIYNNLKSLLERGMIRKISVPGMPDRYDNAVKHDHLVCKKCGRLSDYHFRDITLDLEKQMGTSIDSYELQIMYVCPDCRQTG